jgi:16S rRNA G966 N2-methylase RsmD
VNRLYFGDNLEWLRDRREFPDASVDLVYLDPPFNSNADLTFSLTNRSGWKRIVERLITVVFEIFLARIFSIRYTGISSLMRYVSESP